MREPEEPFPFQVRFPVHRPLGPQLFFLQLFPEPPRQLQAF